MQGVNIREIGIGEIFVTALQFFYKACMPSNYSRIKCLFKNLFPSYQTIYSLSSEQPPQILTFETFFLLGPYAELLFSLLCPLHSRFPHF